jgi:hypothetical protein
MARAGPVVAMENATRIRTPGQPDSYREMQGRIGRLLRIAALAHV